METTQAQYTPDQIKLMEIGRDRIAKKQLDRQLDETMRHREPKVIVRIDQVGRDELRSYLDRREDGSLGFTDQIGPTTTWFDTAEAEVTAARVRAATGDNWTATLIRDLPAPAERVYRLESSRDHTKGKRARLGL